MPLPNRAVLVGCGAAGSGWLRAVAEMSNVQIVGLVDIRLDAAKLMAERFGLTGSVIGTDLAATLRKTNADIVFDCTIPQAHVHVTLEALRRGCHVLGEKPLAVTLDDARRMIAAAHEARRTYAVMQNRRFDRNIRRLRQFIQSGIIGDITTLHTDFFIGAHFGGFRDHMPHVLLTDMAIHTFDAARFVSGANAQTVYCHEWSPPGSWFDHHASAVAVFEMSNQIVYSYRGSWCSEGVNTAWQGLWRVVGQNGSVTWDGEEGFQAQVVAKRGGYRSELRDVLVPEFGGVGKDGGHAGLISDFLRCVETGETPETICTDNVESLAMTLGAVMSAECGTKIAIERPTHMNPEQWASPMLHAATL